MTTATALTWVIGRGGLLGRSVESGFAQRGEVWRPPEPVAWDEIGRGGGQIARLVSQFLAAAEGRAWSVVWCAGTGAPASTESALLIETRALHGTLEALETASAARGGAFFYASSAGGVYAGVDAPPYDEASLVRPISAYGRAKVAAEALVAEWGQRTGTPVLIGRIANLYGPDQNLLKSQGLISQVCRGYLLAKPVSIYVPLDTLRDYLFAPDCAGMVVDAVSRLHLESSNVRPALVTKVLATQRAITVGAVLGEIRRIVKSPARIVTADSGAAAVQVKDLSLRSHVWPELDRRALTPLPVGVAQVVAGLRRQLLHAGL